MGPPVAFDDVDGMGFLARFEPYMKNRNGSE